MSLIDTVGLPYLTIFVKNVYYMITTNIDVAEMARMARRPTTAYRLRQCWRREFCMAWFS